MKKGNKLALSLLLAPAMLVGLYTTNISAEEALESNNPTESTTIVEKTNDTTTQNDNETTPEDTCNKKVFADSENKFLLSETKCTNDKVVQLIKYIRNDKNEITEYLVYNYYENSKVKNYTRYYGATSFKTDVVRHKNIYAAYYNAKGQMTSNNTKENSLMWNASPKTIVKSSNSYKYRGNGSLQQRTTVARSLKFGNRTSTNIYDYYANKKVQRLTNYSYYGNDKISGKKIYNYHSNGKAKNNTFIYYRTNGKRTSYTYRTFANGKLRTKTVYKYNSRGQLKTNKYGKATKFVGKYKNGKRTYAKTYTYKK
ncbi:MAG: hypothetical protein RR543_04115 [Erysipelotrichales bacterium]